MVRRMRERGLLSRERTEEDMRANAVAITQGGRKALKSARLAAERAERMFLEALPAPDRPRFVRLLATIATAGESFAVNGAGRPRRKTTRRLRH
jgi:DNA-binding MarR family transcriptional regulator